MNNEFKEIEDIDFILQERDMLEKDRIKFLNNFKVDGKNVMFVLQEKDATVLRASNNIPNLKVTYADVLGTYDIVANSKLYITKDAIKKLEEAYK